ncbi:hypothetical protein EXM65_18285 [Clostridium botulinum]|uniref:Uncharacterized protein n=1 Tax=Clostridium botulinum TaxID=1491 RepID=A0A6M0ST23_CLOBO|nr:MULTISPECIES: hypothetical protein [Clostridium]MCS6131286.1 hypothetical protein [Clostridium botulinum]NFA44450.1 hypothetical protein [Clostridium botulinum]NFL44627.1 hypothetical protein [Clostridium botulinum]NFL88712.1 hypothetical protein [Clostridium botulinum]NFO11626.1 hypothetical protein [Clostridium botulinum]
MKNADCYDIESICKDFNFVDKIPLSLCDASKNIIDFSSKIFIIEKKVIDTCNIEKLILKGYKLINIEYSADNCTGKILCRKFVIPFFESIAIPSCSKIIDVDANIVYCDIKQCTISNIWLFNIISICLTIYKQKSDHVIHCKNTHNDCFNDWNFKNDCYPPSKTCCCNDNIFINKEDCCYPEQNCKGKIYNEEDKYYPNEMCSKMKFIKKDCYYPKQVYKEKTCSIDMDEICENNHKRF